jgi:hypothetical protein
LVRNNSSVNHCRSSIVRKQSVQLLTMLLQCNPYDASLCVDVLKERLAEESEKLIPLMPKDDAEERAKKWVENEKAFEVYLKEDMENDDDKVTILKNLVSRIFVIVDWAM